MYGGGLMKKTTAKVVIDTTKYWEETPKSVIIDNIELFFGYPITYQILRDNSRIEKLLKITGVSKHAVNAWLNRSREVAKVPLLKLCEIAEYLKVDVEELMNPNICFNRNWDEFDISPRHKRLFQKLSEPEYYNDGKWDIPRFIADMDAVEEYECEDREQQLMDDSVLYFKTIFRLKNEITFFEDVRNKVREYLKGEKNE